MFKTIPNLAVAAFAIALSNFAIAADRPNVLLICIDDLKPQLGCYGDQIAKTPNIDQLAARGVMFESAYCNQAVCSPSRNALLTGLRPQTLGIYDLPTNFRMAAPGAVTVGQHFRAAGYSTQSLGKIFHTGHGNNDDSPSWTEPAWRPRVAGYQLPQSTATPKTRKDGSKLGNATENADVPDDAYADGLIAAEAVRRIEAASKKVNEPFFLAVGFLKPHLPFVAPKKYWDLYDPKTMPMPSIQSAPIGAPEYAPTASGELWAYADMPSRGPVDETTARNLIHGYFAATSYTDAQIGRVLTALDSTGLSKNTIVVLWGDHGWHLGDHGMWCKHSNYEQAARIPVIVAAPDGAKNAKSKSMIESVDIYPTLTDLAGLTAPPNIDGLSFAKVVRDPDTKTRDSVIHVYPRGQRLGRAIRTQRYRLVEWKQPGAASDTAELELYDYQSDPLETKNVAGEKPDVVKQILQILESHPEAKPSIAGSGK